MEKFYLVDGILLGSHAYLRSQLVRFASPKAQAYGLRLRTKSCKVWWPTLPSIEVQRKYPSQSMFEYNPKKWHTKNGIEILGAAIRDHAFHAEYIRAKTMNCISFLKMLPKVGESHIAFELLRKCFSSARVINVLRSSPPSAIEQTATLLDDALRRTFNSIMGFNALEQLDAEFWAEILLPIYNKTSNDITLGLGITQVVSVSHHRRSSQRT